LKLPWLGETNLNFRVAIGLDDTISGTPGRPVTAVTTGPIIVTTMAVMIWFDDGP
jgi:hypothetical protein